MSTTNVMAMGDLTAATPLQAAGEFWIRRLELAGLDGDLPEDEELEAEEIAERDAQRHHARQTVNAYQTALTLFLRWLEREGRTRAADLQPDDIVRYTRSLRRSSYDLSEAAQRRIASGDQPERLAVRTIHAYSRPLFGFLLMLEQAGALGFRAAVALVELKRFLPRLPAPSAPTPPDLRRLVAYYDKSQDANEDPQSRTALIRLRNAALLHLLFSTGARISEALSLNVGDVCRDRRVQSRAILQGKGRQEGTIFIRRHAEQALTQYLAARNWPAAGEALFESLDRRTAGMRLSRVSGWRIVHAAAEAVAAQTALEGKLDEAAMLRETSPHTFRHFVGFFLLNEGVALAEVSQILRHRSVEVTRSYYARYQDVQLQEVHDQFSADPNAE
ncbi:MAG: tyrosine-type recombinase/integrase [Oscillochloris sp.]|nr:tyrosine-type recombinase/integrase [Oscillochloris sp.]